MIFQWIINYYNKFCARIIPALLGSSCPPSLVLLVVCTFLAIQLHSVCFVLHLSQGFLYIHDVVKKVLAKLQRSSVRSQNTFVGERALEFKIISFTVK